MSDLIVTYNNDSGFFIYVIRKDTTEDNIDVSFEGAVAEVEEESGVAELGGLLLSISDVCEGFNFF